MYFTFFKYILHIIKKNQPKPSGDQATKSFCTDGTRKTSFTEIKLWFCNVIKKKKKLKVA